MKVFCDTNVLVAAFVSRGLCADLLRAVLTHEELVTGEMVLDELARVLRERLKAPEELVDLALDLLGRHTVVARPGDPWPGPVGDPDDTWVLASALAAGADVLVTGDSDLLDLEPIPEIRILFPRELWQTLASRNEGESEDVRTSGGEDVEDDAGSPGVDGAKRDASGELEYPPPGDSSDDLVHDGFEIRRRHTDLDAWRQGIELVKVIYQKTSAFPGHEQFGLTSQLRRASISIPANIAEGAARGSGKEFIRFLTIARGSLVEVETLLVIAREVGYLDTEHEAELMAACHRLSAILNGLLRSIHREA